jgi:hypothetical protein
MSIAALIIAALFVAYTLMRAEFEKYELKKEIAELRTERDKLLKRAPVVQMQSNSDDNKDSARESLTQQAVRRGRPGRFESFGRAKQILESQPEPQRSVNV